MDQSTEQLGPSSLMSEVLTLYPWAQRALFRKYHIGGCSSCAFDPEETMAMLCERNDKLDPAEVLKHVKESHDQDASVQISPKEVDALMKQGEVVKLLDIRTKEEWDGVRLASATRMSQDSMQDILGNWPREGMMVIYDHTGKNSLDAATYFQGQRFLNVRCLAGGIDAWSQEVDSDIRRYRLEA